MLPLHVDQSPARTPLIPPPSPSQTVASGGTLHSSTHSRSRASSEASTHSTPQKSPASHHSVASVHSTPHNSPAVQHALVSSPHMLTQSPAPAPLVEAPSPTQTLAQSAAKADSRTPSLHLFDPAEHAKKIISTHSYTESSASTISTHTESNSCTICS